MKSQKGITLIALVITIIVLLILAGVSIAMLTGENGILTQANSAKSDTDKAQATEKINLALNAVKAKVYEMQVGSDTYNPISSGALESHITSTLALDTDQEKNATDSENNGKIVYYLNGTTLEITYYNTETNVSDVTNGVAAKQLKGEIDLDTSSDDYLEITAARLVTK